MKNYSKFTTLWITNVVLLYLSTVLLPTSFSLGNSLFTPMQAALFTGFVWNYALWNAEGEFKKFDLTTKSAGGMMMLYLAFNVVVVWLLARFAFMTGFGVASALHVFGLAFVANIVQYQVWKATDKK